MTLGTFLMTFGLVGASLLIGLIVRTFWIADQVRGVGVWLVALLFMGGVGAVVTSYNPVVEPLWLHYVWVAVVPFAVSFVGLSLLIGRSSRTE